MMVKYSVLYALRTDFYVFLLPAFFGRGHAFLKARVRKKNVKTALKNAKYGTL